MQSPNNNSNYSAPITPGIPPPLFTKETGAGATAGRRDGSSDGRGVERATQRRRRDGREATPAGAPGGSDSYVRAQPSTLGKGRESSGPHQALMASTWKGHCGIRLSRPACTRLLLKLREGKGEGLARSSREGRGDRVQRGTDFKGRAKRATHAEAPSLPCNVPIGELLLHRRGEQRSYAIPTDQTKGAVTFQGPKKFR